MFASSIPEIFAGTGALMAITATGAFGLLVRDFFHPGTYGRHLRPARRSRAHRIIYPND